MSVVNRWSKLRGYLCYKRSNWDFKNSGVVGAIGRWSLFEGGLRFDCKVKQYKAGFMSCVRNKFFKLLYKLKKSLVNFRY